MNSNFRILCIDGGGVRGYLAASILTNLEQLLNAQDGHALAIGQRFDLIAGTSAGGLIALALAEGRFASDVQAWFSTFVPKVFTRRNRWQRSAEVIRPRYSTSPLVPLLSEFFGSRTLADLKCDVCVPAVSLADAKARMYKTDYFARNAGRLDETLLDIALATTAAPTYFEARSTKHSVHLVDGGLAANNPSLVALIDAVQFERNSKRGTPPPEFASRDSNVVLLSVGTGAPGPTPYHIGSLLRGGWWNWRRALHEVILTSQSDMTHEQARFLLRHKYHRINPYLSAPVELDDVAHFLALRDRAAISAPDEAFAVANLL